MAGQKKGLKSNLSEFRRKYYLDKILRGTLLLLLIVSSILFVVLLGEGLFGFSSGVRTTLVVLLGLGLAGVLWMMVLRPASQLFNILPGINDMDIARMVRNAFPEVNDKLINLLQLRRYSQSHSLAAAAVHRKEQEILPVRLSNAVNLNLNRRYFYWLLVPIGLYLLTFLVSPDFISSSTYRLIHYNQEFVPPPPFEIQLSDLPAQMVAGENYPLEIQLRGDELPANLFLFMRDDRNQGNQFVDFNLEKKSPSEYHFTFNDLKGDFSFYVGNAEVRSETYSIEVLRRPFIKTFRVMIQYPAYTGLGREMLQPNVGDFKAVKGSQVRWELFPNEDVTGAWFVAEDSLAFDRSEDGAYQLNRRLMQDLDYFIGLNSERGISNIDTVRYRVSAVADRHPSIYVHALKENFEVDIDPTLPLDVEIADDYGFTKMSLFYRFSTADGNASGSYREMPLTIDKRTLLQPLNYNIDLTQFGLDEGEEIEFFLKVWDNDGVSGPKSATSGTFKVSSPTLDARYEEVEAAQQGVKDNIEKLQKKSDELQDAYQKLQEKLLAQKKLSFDDKKELERMLDEHQNLMKEISDTQKAFEENKEKMQQNQMISEQTLEKFDDLNQMLEEMENPEIEKLLEEIQEKLDELSPENLKEQLDQLQMNDEDLKENLERTLELLKQLEVQQKLDEIRNKLDQMEARQNVLNEQTEKAESPEELDRLSDKQEQLEEDMKKVQEDLQELDDMKSDTKTPDEEKMEDLQEKGDETRQDMQEASEKMDQAGEKSQEKGKKNQKQAGEMKQQAGQKQKDAAQKMQEMSEQLEGMQMEMGMQQDQQNLEDLRELLENLLKLSFDQEDLRDEVKDLKYGDPVLKEKSQDQRKLQDDMGLVKDSLQSLANRVFQIQKFVLDESRKIEDNMDKSQEFFRNKQVQMVTYHQQSAMTSINNLANMLSDVMQQIQQQMMTAKSGQAMCPKPGQSQNQQMSEMQRQLNQQMQQMMQNKQGMDPQRLAEMAAQQEAIRKQLQEYHEKLREKGGKALGDMDKIAGDMKDTENELANRQLTAETMMRQKQILNRLLQAERSIRERELDNKRESKTANILERKSPEELSIEEYKEAIRQEMLKSNKLEYSSDFIILIEQYYKKLEGINER